MIPVERSMFVFRRFESTSTRRKCRNTVADAESGACLLLSPPLPTTSSLARFCRGTYRLAGSGFLEVTRRFLYQPRPISWKVEGVPEDHIYESRPRISLPLKSMRFPGLDKAIRERNSGASHRPNQLRSDPDDRLYESKV